ncbi:NAD(P)H-binding protein [Jiangella endophytica]|uniref:NAD(P)H-binding protein n=1 Tax=Jiangella endophytica TaxID=1623398 RepID=UPI000E355915|nr:NAD(P)H-binding protein [Jiangella endophytica]
MPDLPPLAVTGATGVLGGAVARNLADAAVAHRLLVRSPDRAPRLPGTVALSCDYGDADAAAAALAGVRTLLMVSASESAERLAQHRTFIEAARTAGVEHIVYTSFFGAAPDATFTLARDHDATEAMIRATGLAHTFLRDNLYLDFFEAMVGDDGVIRGPAGDGRVAGVARADVARVAATVLRDPAAHRDVTYDLTGPQALTMSEVAGLLSAARGSTVAFHDETVAEAYESRRRWNAPDWQLDAWVSTYTAIAAGELAAVSPDVERVTGRAPMSLADVLAH